MGPRRGWRRGFLSRPEIALRLPLSAAVLAALLPLTAAATDVADPAAAVPRAAYRSVFDGLPRGIEEASVPWKDANAGVAQFPRGHIDLLKWEERNGAAPGTEPLPAAAVPTAPGTAPATAPATRGHVH
jgi:hypothetical protein